MINPLISELIHYKTISDLSSKFKQKYLTAACIFRQNNIQIGHYTGI